MAFLDRSSKESFHLNLVSEHQEYLKLANPLTEEIQLKNGIKQVLNSITEIKVL